MKKLIVLVICSLFIIAPKLEAQFEENDRTIGFGASYVSPMGNDLSDSDRASFINSGIGLDTEAQFEFTDNNVFIYLGVSWFTANGSDELLDSTGVEFGFSNLQVEFGGKLYFADLDKFTGFAGLYLSYNSNTHLNVEIGDNSSGYIDDRFYEHPRTVNTGLSLGISYPVRKNEFITLEGRLQTLSNSIFDGITKVTLKYNFNLVE